MMRIGTCAVMMFLLADCSPAVVQGALNEDSVAGTNANFSKIERGDAIIVKNLGSNPDDDGIASCVRANMASEEADFRIMPEEEFRKSLFPWFKYSVDVNTIAAAIENPLVRNRIAEMRVRYLIVVDADTTTKLGDGLSGTLGYVGESGAMTCGNTGCLGLTAWNRVSDLSAVIWDINKGVEAGRLEAQVSGIVLMPALVLPVPLIMPTETAACIALGKSLTRFITTGALPKKPEVESSQEKSLSEPNK